MKKRFLLFYPVLAFTIMLCSSCSGHRTFTEFTDSVFLEEISSNTLNLHYTIQDPAAYGIRDYALSLGSCSVEATRNSKAGLNKLKQKLSAFPYQTLTTEEKLTYDILSDYIDTSLALCEYPLYEEPLAFSGGVQIEMPLLFAEYPFSCEQDVKDYLALLSQFDAFLLETLAFEQAKAKAGLFMSDDLALRTIESCRTMIASEPSEHFLIQTFESRLHDLVLSPEAKARYISSNACIVTKKIIPTYQVMIQELTALLGSGKYTGGLCHLPNGKDYYTLLVYAETGTTYDIDALFDKIEHVRFLDLLLCADLQEQNPSLFSETDPDLLPFNSPHSVLSHLQLQMNSDFPAAPSVNCSFLPVHEALSDFLAPAFYIVAPMDAYGDHCIYLNGDPDTSDIYCFTTLAHEGFPGHLYQTVMSYEYELPAIRNLLNYPGYVEGWATYVEILSFSYSGIHPDWAEMLSHNQSALLSLYATSDIGLHYYGWSEEEMYAFWASYGITHRETIDEITRLILAEPGNYLKYYVGYLEFCDLKNTAKQYFGTDFSAKEFHRAVLDIGPAPFSLLEKYLPLYYSIPQT